MQIGEETLVRSVFSVIGLFAGHLQKRRDNWDFEIQQKRAVEQQKVFLSPLGIARKFHTVQRQIRVPFDFNLDFQVLLHQLPLAFHDELVCLRQGSSVLRSR